MFQKNTFFNTMLSRFSFVWISQNETKFYFFCYFFVKDNGFCKNLPKKIEKTMVFNIFQIPVGFLDPVPIPPPLELIFFEFLDQCPPLSLDPPTPSLYILKTLCDRAFMFIYPGDLCDREFLFIYPEDHL